MRAQHVLLHLLALPRPPSSHSTLPAAAAPCAAFTVFRTTGVWLYPFLDASKPWAPFAYGGIYAGSWVFFGLVTLQFRMRSWLFWHRRALKHD